MSNLELLLCLALISASAFLSASEIALFSLSRFQLRHLKEGFPKVHARIKRLLADPSGVLITILVTNEIVSISLSTIIAESLAEAFPEHSPWFLTVIGMAVTTPIVLFLCEITPKVVAAKMNQLIASVTIKPLTWVYKALAPVRWVLKRLVNFVSRQTGKDTIPHDAHADRPMLREEEFLVMVEEGHREGAIEQSEMDLIRNVFDLDDTIVRDVKTPLSKVFSLPMSTTLKGALQALKGQKFSRIPITGRTKKQIVGILYAKDLLRARTEPELLDRPVTSVMRKPLTVGPDMKLNILFRRLKQNKTHMAVVISDGSGAEEATGIVTMDDVLEELVGDLLGNGARGKVAP